ncbi:M16 family metallopeptidase [Enterovibrio norvegicus]|uniref:Peptidase M16 n=1 Tax=Enterovibrio norvegicus TaxID=188144 RepID=A0A2N7L9J9_9GAMM|nr:insulinase family protein [Enterovibrio norvegicus]PMN91101.1 hypothetical protein BCT23_18505 [Enterovibrio norvegicus]
MRLLVTLATLFLLMGCQSTSSSKLDADPEWVTGKLENGLTYHIYASDKHTPVSLRFIFEAGSLQETDTQLGYAHFVEHMAFNGSEHFEQNGILDYMRSIGATFGPDVNAYTSEKNTVYVLDLPNNAHLDKAFNWFNDIANGLNLDANEVEKEKGVIVGEWRDSRRENKSAYMYMYEKAIAQSQLAARDPIGTVPSIESATDVSLRQFYETWYQPQLAHLVVVGDVSVEEIKAHIQRELGKWERGNTPAPDTYVIPTPLSETILQPALSAEGASASFAYDLGPTATENKGQLFNQWTNEGTAYLIRERLEDELLSITGKPNSVEVGITSAGERDFLIIRGLFPAERREEAQTVIVETLASMRDRGVDDKAVGNIRWYQDARKYYRQYDDNLLPKDRISNFTWAFMRGEPSLGTEDLLSLRLAWSRTLNRYGVSDHLETMLSSEPVVFGFWLDDEQEAQVEDLLVDTHTRLMEQGKKRGSRGGNTLLAAVSHNGTVIAEQKKTETLNVWTLSNGVEVWYQQNPKAKEQVRIVVGDKGGRALLPEHLVSASFLMPDALFLSGLAGQDAQGISRYLNERSTAIWPEITPTRHALHIDTNRYYMDDALALTHHLIQSPAFTEEGLALSKQKVSEDFKNFHASINGKYDDAVFNKLRNDNPAYRLSTVEDIDTTSLADISAVHDVYFSKARNTKVYIVGNLSPNRLKRAVAKNLGGIVFAEPSVPELNIQSDTWSLALSDVLGVSEEEKGKGLSALYVLSEVENDQSAEVVFIDDILSRIATRKVLNSVREQASLSYSPGSFELSIDNEKYTGWAFAASVNPHQAKQANDLFEGVVQDMAKGVSDDEATVASTQLREALQGLDENAHHQANIFSRYLFNGWGVDALLDVNKTIDGISPEEISDRAKLIFGKQSKVVRAYNMPEGVELPE